ncbi:hypothetical protein ON010_g18270 [Phytophthora cinnamomi]|nr:hypothetical protein ON010_g18270 [Phytophthora cinnamomi]
MRALCSPLSTTLGLRYKVALLLVATGDHSYPSEASTRRPPDQLQLHRCHGTQPDCSYFHSKLLSTVSALTTTLEHAVGSPRFRCRALATQENAHVLEQDETGGHEDHPKEASSGDEVHASIGVHTRSGENLLHGDAREHARYEPIQHSLREIVGVLAQNAKGQEAPEVLSNGRHDAPHDPLPLAAGGEVHGCRHGDALRDIVQTDTDGECEADKGVLRRRHHRRYPSWDVVDGNRDDVQDPKAQ